MKSLRATLGSSAFDATAKVHQFPGYIVNAVVTILHVRKRVGKRSQDTPDQTHVKMQGFGLCTQESIQCQVISAQLVKWKFKEGFRGPIGSVRSRMIASHS